jgi:hypothetical protein
MTILSELVDFDKLDYTSCRSKHISHLVIRIYVRHVCLSEDVYDHFLRIS